MQSQFPVLCSSNHLKPELEKFQRIPITSEVFKLGRGPQNTVVLPNKFLSKDHCIFTKVDNDWMIENCSYSSIKVNGNKLRKGQKWKLRDEDIIKLDSSNELVYMFTKNSNENVRKRRKPNVNNENVKKRLEEPSTTSNQNEDKIQFTSEKQKELMSEQNRKEKEIYNEYASRIEKLKGSKRTVKRQKALLKVRRDAQLASMRVEMAGKMASLMEKSQNEVEKRENSPKEPPKQIMCPEVCKDSPRQEAMYRLRARIREQDRVRMREKKELRKLRKETEQLRLDREKKLKELEKQKLIREKELQEELNKLNKKLAKQIERVQRAEQLLDQQKEQKLEPSPGDSTMDMESELQCSVCSELFVKATTLGCSHSFCQYCINKWHRNKSECPICRAPITSKCRSIVLDSLVAKMAESSEDGKKKRLELMKAREALEAAEATTADTSRSSFPDYGFSPELRDYYGGENSDSNSSYYGRESSLEPDPDLLVDDDDDEDEEAEGEDSEEEFSTSDNLDEDEFIDEDEDENSPENYEHENSAPEDEEGEISAEHYDEGENPEHYDEGENPEHDEGENPELYDEGEHSAPENYDEGEFSAPEHYDEGENSAPEHYDEGENSAPEHYDEAEFSAPEYEEQDNDGGHYEENYNDHENVEYNEGDSAPECFENEFEGDSMDSYPYGFSDHENDDDDYY